MTCATKITALELFHQISNKALELSLELRHKDSSIFTFSFQANIVRQILCMLEGLLPSMKNTDEDDYFMKPREKVGEVYEVTGSRIYNLNNQLL